MSTLFSAIRFFDLMLFLDTNHLNKWEFRRWGVKMLVVERKIDEALDFALATQGNLSDKYDIAETCENILIKNGRLEEAYKRFAFKVNQAGGFEKTCEKIYKKYSIPLGKIKMDYQFYNIESPYFDPTED